MCVPPSKVGDGIGGPSTQPPILVTLWVVCLFLAEWPVLCPCSLKLRVPTAYVSHEILAQAHYNICRHAAAGIGGHVRVHNN